MSFNFPNAPTVGQTFTPASGPTYQWDGEKWATTTSTPISLPVAFSYFAKPAASSTIFVSITTPITIPASLTGTWAYVNTASTATATFTLNKISSGSTTALGTIAMTAGSKTAFTLAGAGGALATGDVLQMVAPSTQDTTMADVGITIQATRT
jgi:hypothetical protein